MKRTKFILVALLLLPLAMISPAVIPHPEGITALTNGDFEAWTAGDADGWTKDTSLEDDEETTLIHGGSSACNLTLTSTSTQYYTTVISGVVGDEVYTFSYWAIDNDTGGRFRLYGYFRDNGGSNTGSAVFTDYGGDNASWTEFSITATAPSDAVEFYFSLRFYDVSAGWDGESEFTLDDVTVTGLLVDPAPSISAHTHRPWTPSAGESVTFKANVTDDTSVDSVEVIISTDGFATNTTLAMNDPDTDDMYNCSYIAPAAGTTITYAFNATDNIGQSTFLWNAYMNFTVMDSYPFISEFFISSGDDDYIILSNPDTSAVDISGWIITDEGGAELDYQYDSAYAFPASTSIPADDFIVIATNGLAFEETLGKAPDFAHMNGSDVGAIDLIQVAGTGDFDLYQYYEEIVLLNPNGAVVDVVPYDNPVASGYVGFDGDKFLTESDFTSLAGDIIASASADTDDPNADFSMIPFGTGLVSPAFILDEILFSQVTIALNGSVDIAVAVNWADGSSVNGTDYPTINVTYNVPAMAGGDIDLVYDTVSEYYNGTIDFTNYIPSTDSYGFYHTTEVGIDVDGGDDYGTTSGNTGVFVNPGYDAADTVILFDEAHDGYYGFSDYAPTAEWVSVLFETDIADYIVFLDTYDFNYRINSDVLVDVDLFVVTSPDSDASKNFLQASEITAIVDYVEAGGALWFSGEGGAYCDPLVNGLDAMTGVWGIEWFDGYYQDPTHNAGQNNHALPSIAFSGGTAFDDFGAFGAEEFYFNGMVINHSVDIAGATVTEVIEPRDTSNWDDSADTDYDPNMNPIADIYSLAYLVENGSGEAFILASSSLFGHYDDFQDGVESAQFALNVFCYLLNVSAVRFPTLTLVDNDGAQTVTNDNDAVTFSVTLSSSIAGATLYDVEVAGTIEGDLVEFTAAGAGVYTATWDATFSDAGTYTLEVSAEAETEVGAMYIGSEIEISITVEEGAVDTTTTTTTTGGSTPGFGMISVLLILSVIGLAFSKKRRR